MKNIAGVWGFVSFILLAVLFVVLFVACDSGTQKRLAPQNNDNSVSLPNEKDSPLVNSRNSPGDPNRSVGNIVRPFFLSYPYATPNNSSEHISVDSDSYFMVPIEWYQDYLIIVHQASDDINLFIYDDAKYTNLICSSLTKVNASTCAVYSGRPFDKLLYIRVSYAGSGSGGTYSLTINQEILRLWVDDNSMLSFIDNEQDVSISLTNDLSNSPARTVIAMNAYDDPAIDIYHHKLQLTLVGDRAGTYTIGENATARFESFDDGLNLDDGFFANGTITIDEYGPEYHLLSGSFDMSLCEVGLDCSYTFNRKFLLGEFTVLREVDILSISSEGSVSKPIPLTNPYMTGSIDIDRVGVDNDSYFQVPLNLSTNYVVALSKASDDISLFLYDDINFSNLVCASTTGLTSESCTLNSGESLSLLYIRIHYTGQGDGATFTLMIDQEMISMEGDVSLPATFSDNGENIVITATHDKLSVPMRTQIDLTVFDDPVNKNIQTALQLTVFGSTADTFVLGENATARYESLFDGLNIDDNNYANGFIKIDHFGPEKNLVMGSYEITLCEAGMACLYSFNRRYLSGSFTVLREIDITSLTSVGSKSNPVSLDFPYSTEVDVFERVGPDADSYYRIPVDWGRDYTFVLSQISDDVSLFVYEDDNYSNLLCSSSIGVTSEHCSTNSNFSATNFLYIRVSQAGSIDGSSFLLSVMRENVMLWVDNGSALSFSDNGSSRSITAIYNSVSSPKRTTIELDVSEDLDTNQKLINLNLTLFGDQTGTYTLGKDATANYDSSIDGLNIDDNNFANGTITIEELGAEYSLITGSYDINLCAARLNCSYTFNRIYLSGNFTVLREADRQVQ